MKKFDDNGKSVLVLGDDSFCRWDSSSLLYVSLSGLSIAKVSEGA